MNLPVPANNDTPGLQLLQQMQALLGQYKQDNQELQEQVASLKHQLAWFKHQLFGEKSEKRHWTASVRSIK